MCSNTGVFVGVEASGLVRGRKKDGGVFSASGGALSITSGRLSYTLGLVGPCYSIDTACASALAAMHVSTMAVDQAECGAGTDVGTKVLSEAANLGACLAGMTSPHGRCHTFDERADGYCRGEGCCAFVVSCIRSEDGPDSIVASAVQQDGPSASLTAPNGLSQRRLIQSVQRSAGERMDATRSMEAHGTGTTLGDPIEVLNA